MEILYQLNCESCGAEYEILCSEEDSEEPMYCPFCSSEVSLEDMEESDLDQEGLFDEEDEDFDLDNDSQNNPKH